MISRKRKKIIIFLILIIIIHFYLGNISNLKVAICTIALKDKLYIKEYIDYYKKLGIDHIFIYDNYNENKEKIIDIIGKSYKYYVTIYKNINKNLSLAYTTCYNNNNNKFDWILMNDIDEYLIIKNETLKNYLSNKIFKQCDFIKMHLIQPTDNNLFYYKKKPLFERYKGTTFMNNISIKSFVRGNIKDLQYNNDTPSSELRNISCNNLGKKYNYNKSSLYELFDYFKYNKAYIIHYKYKISEEFINKFRKDCSKFLDQKFLSMRIEDYFKDNELSLEKIDYIEKQLNLNLSKYKKNFIYKKKQNFKKNLIIGVFSNYNWKVVEPFFISFKRVGFENCDCIMFVNKIKLETKKKIESFGVIIHEVPNKLKNYRIINYRWKIYEDFLKDNQDKYNIVFTTDLRDSFFQKNVFNYYDFKQSFLGVAIEDGIISYDALNRNWVLNAYGKEVLKIIGNERIICIGTVWGTADKFLEFSKIMWEKLSSEWSLKFNVIEQGVTNFLIYYDKLFNECLVKSDNQNGYIMTIGLTKSENINFDSDNNILNGKGEIAAVIHQYDRKIDIVEKVKKKYCLNLIH